MRTAVKTYDQVMTALLVRKLLRASTKLASMPHGDNGMVGEWWRGLSDASRIAHYRTLNMASRYVDLMNGVAPWPASETFDGGSGPDELARLERQMEARTKALV